MSIKPIDLMLERVNRARSDSDTAFFHELLYAGELVVKLTTAAFVASIDDDREHHRYRLLHTVIRADGLGEWSRVLDDALSGPASQNLAAAIRDDRRALIERLDRNTWQYKAGGTLQNVLRLIQPTTPGTPVKVALRAWFASFAELRNKTRGHGAPTADTCVKGIPDLEKSIQLLCANNPVFRRPWAYLHRNLSGRYRVVQIGGDPSAFSRLTRSDAIGMVHYSDGVYLGLDSPRLVNLVHTNLELSDFFLPNGDFNGKRYELHSLITDNCREGDASPYLASASDRPPSETHGLGQLDVVGNVWTNLPSVPSGYVGRPRLEREIIEILTNDRHPIVTLVGSGGIGKTSLALTTLHELTKTNRYDAIIWFSARDIDLSLSGPKIVKSQVLTEKDIANEFVNLLGLSAADEPRSTSIDAMAANLRESTIGGPILFVFDNCETVRSPTDLFQWIDTNIRLPNKALITSRFRDFKADYPIDIAGMERVEAEELITKTALALNISNFVTDKFKNGVFEESDGHPYVIKIILGEVANKGRVGKPEHLIARKEDILDALFERTFENLSPLANRMFLTLSGWRSLVPQLALEAVVLRGQNERADPESAVDELVRMSLIQRTKAQDGSDFLDTPLTAAIFGHKKLSVSPIKMLIENDIRLLQDLGPANVGALKGGIRPRIEGLIMARQRLPW